MELNLVRTLFLNHLLSSPLYLSLTKLRTGRFLLSLAGDALAATLGFFIFFYHPAWFTFLIASIVIGASQHALAVLGHEAVHGRICKNKVLNDLIGNVFCFFPVGITVSTYREFHLPHHKKPNSDQDPEIPLRKALGHNWQPPYTLKRATILWLQSFFGYSLRELGIFVMKLPVGRLSEKFGMLALWGASAIILHKAGCLIALGIWVYSLATSYFSFLRFQGWYEHSVENSEHTNRYSLPNFAYRFLLPHNIWVHYEHHKYPSIPFYHLERVRDMDKDEKILSFAEMIDLLQEADQTTTANQKKIA